MPIYTLCKRYWLIYAEGSNRATGPNQIASRCLNKDYETQPQVIYSGTGAFLQQALLREAVLERMAMSFFLRTNYLDYDMVYAL